jgi:hypothetical protein
MMTMVLVVVSQGKRTRIRVLRVEVAEWDDL